MAFKITKDTKISNVVVSFVNGESVVSFSELIDSMELHCKGEFRNDYWE